MPNSDFLPIPDFDVSTLSSSGQLVDMEAAREFIGATLEKITLAEFRAVEAELQDKSLRIQAMLQPDQIQTLQEKDLIRLLRAVFSTRRRAKRILNAVGLNSMKTGIHDLLYGPEILDHRFQKFIDAMTGYFDDIRVLRPKKSSDSRAKKSAEEAALKENIFCDLGSEILHFTSPHQYWLWTRWIWDPNAGTGAIPLVTNDEVDLFGNSVAETYIKIGGATHFIQATGQAASFEGFDNGPFSIDVFLACVYVVYMYTTLRMRMTQEFNKLVPQMPELTRRLLGVWKLDL